MTNLPAALGRARERAHYSQEDAASALGVSRTMISYWETGEREPNDRQLNGLARLYGIELLDLLTGSDVEPIGGDLAGMMLRSGSNVDPEAQPGIRDFISFLNRHAELAGFLDESIRGLSQSPYVSRGDFSKREDAHRKAEEVRSHLRLGVGPISDMDTICQMLGITLYRTSMGADLSRVPSGAFLNHPEIGFSILVNLDMTPGRRRFTVAHELAHALFHSNKNRFVISQGGGSLERFADNFAAEFLMPAEGVRRYMEDTGLPSKIEEAADSIQIQRYFNVSWAMALVQLRRMGMMSGDTFMKLRREVSPVILANSLGYTIGPEEYEQDIGLWRINRFPRPFLRMLRKAVKEDVMSVPSAASFAGLAIPDVTQILEEGTQEKTFVESSPDEPPDQMPPFRYIMDSSALMQLARLGKIPEPETEFREYEVTGVF